MDLFMGGVKVGGGMNKLHLSHKICQISSWPSIWYQTAKAEISEKGGFWKGHNYVKTFWGLPALLVCVPLLTVNNYRKNSKIWDTSNNCHSCPKNRKVWCNFALMHPKDADGMANSVDPDQTASSEAVWSWSALFAETYLSQYIEFVRYSEFQENIFSNDRDIRKCQSFCMTTPLPTTTELWHYLDISFENSWAN